MSGYKSGTSRHGVGKPEWVPINDSVVCLNLPEIQLSLNTPKAGCAYMTDNQQRKDKNHQGDGRHYYPSAS